MYICRQRWSQGRQAWSQMAQQRVGQPLLSLQTPNAASKTRGRAWMFSCALVQLPESLWISLRAMSQQGLGLLKLQAAQLFLRTFGQWRASQWECRSR